MNLSTERKLKSYWQRNTFGIDFISLCSDFKIPFVQSNNHHAREGWIQICCPFCNDTSFHLGYNTEKGYFNCYRCGHIKVYDVLTTLTGKTFKKLLKKYSISLKKETESYQNTAPTISTCYLPPKIKKVNKEHINYLLSRKIDLRAVSVWNLMGVGNTLDRFRKRIIAPIFQTEKIINWVSRDITGKNPHRYLNCPDNKAIVPLKQTLYGDWLINTENDIIIVEGIFDALRFGAGAIALYGVNYSNSQIKLLRQYKNKYILFDMDKTGRKKAQKLADELSAFDGDVEIIHYNAKDPAELSQREANIIKKEILKKECY